MSYRTEQAKETRRLREIKNKLQTTLSVLLSALETHLPQSRVMAPMVPVVENAKEVLKEAESIK